MLKQTVLSRGLFSVVSQELKKAAELLSFELDQKMGTAKVRAAEVGKILQGTDGTPEQLQREQKHKQAYQEILAKQQAKANEAFQEKLATKTNWKERLQFQLNEAVQSAKAATSKKSGVVALIQHCAAAHAAEVAVEQGIDVHSVQIVLENQTVAKGIAAETKVVGYIDAPQASEAEVMEFAQRLTKACPAARAMEAHIEWRRRGAGGEPVDSGDGSSQPPVSPWRSGEPMPMPPPQDNATTGTEDMQQAEAKPEAVAGTPGSRRLASEASSIKKKNPFRLD